MHSYKLTAHASYNIISIWEYTKDAWGESQADTYIKEVHETLIMICRNPKVGKLRNNIFELLRSFPCREHVIFYKVSSKRIIQVVGVVHKNMDIDTMDFNLEKLPN